MKRISVRSCALTVLGMAAVGLFGMSACKKRAFNSSTKNTTSTAAAGVFETSIPADYNADRLIYIGVQSSYSSPGRDLTPTGAVDGKGNAVRESFFPMFTPWLYFVKYVKNSDRAVKVPRTLPKAYFLQLMNKMRDDWQEYSPTRTTQRTEPAVDMNSFVDPKAVSQKDQMLMRGKYDYATQSSSDASDCLGNAASHWSDLQLHWYCQLPYGVRNCYSTGIRAAVDFTASEITAGTPITYAYDKHREMVMSMCTGKATFDPQVQQPAYSIEMFNKFYNEMWVPSDASNPASEKVNVFEYVMRAQTYANDLQEEQDILNEFYGAWKAADKPGEPAFDAKNAEDCRKFRPQRGIETAYYEDEVKDIDYCKVGKIFSSPHASLGR